MLELHMTSNYSSAGWKTATPGKIKVFKYVYPIFDTLRIRKGFLISKTNKWLLVLKVL